MKPTVTRFAPSPTGALHAGTVRTALFAWLLARHNNGKFILRIEDTDRAREVEGAVKNIVDSLHYVGIDWDQGPDKEDLFGPYFQSQRLDRYKEWGLKLISSGRAYADPYSEKELQEFRDKAKRQKKAFMFRDIRPKNPPLWDGKQPLRFLSEPKNYSWHDAVMGEMHSTTEAVDDFILIKSDGYPTYNFAHIIDDLLMNVTHVIRSQEFISSIPRYLNLYEALDIPIPILATLPQVLNHDNQRKLSKREGAKQILEYKKMGVLPEALINFLATLGWNDGTTQEFYSVQELIEKFDLSRVQRSGAHFDEERLFWLNGHYIRNMNLDELFVKVESFWPKNADDYDDLYRKKVLGLVQERLKYFDEIEDLTSFFFKDLEVNPELIASNPKLSKIDKNDLVTMLQTARKSLSESNFGLNDLTQKLNNLLLSTNQKPAILFSLIRIATTQSKASPGLAESLNVLGKEVTLRRIDQMISSL